jgi:S-adenosylmethionine:tRNA ribosyltransferase-isomerase
MRTDLFDFDLPEERIALRPASPRDSARLLVVRPQGGRALEDRILRELPDLLAPGDALVLNDTKVIPAALSGVRARGDNRVAVIANLHKRARPDAWWAFAKPGRRLAVGDRIRFGETADSAACLLGTLDAEIEAKGEGGEILLRFVLSGAYLDEAIARVGAPPLPPYIAAKRPADDKDVADYQTVYAREDGSVAAPTAGLHFTEGLLARLADRGVSSHRVTLHVGAGTFLPVKAEDTAEHRMHAEYGRVDAAVVDALLAARERGGRAVAVGTTAMRLLESAAAASGTLAPFAGETDIFITPGFRFRAVDALLTNFHLPRSTLFMLVAAFSGLDTMKRAYAHAIASGYRFYSYGDASLLFPETAR